ncbi:hypothetical protein B0J11DRAFT_411729, partial [Dendryphion nanum]
LKLVCCSLAFMLFGFSVGHSVAQHLSSLADKIPGMMRLTTKPTLFEYQPLYNQGVRNSDAGWEIMVPINQGILKHPKIAPDGGRFAAVGQLECLNMVRESYWKLVDVAVSPKELEIKSLPHKISPDPVGQCIDTLRQALKCTPDFTVRAVASRGEFSKDMTTFGAAQPCKNWDQLAALLKSW